MQDSKKLSSAMPNPENLFTALPNSENLASAMPNPENLASAMPNPENLASAMPNPKTTPTPHLNLEVIRNDQQEIIDIACIQAGRTLQMLGAGQAKRELSILTNVGDLTNCLPVFLGSGLGLAMEALLQNYSGPMAIIDKEIDILQHTQLQTKFSQAQIFWITTPNPELALKSLSQWQAKHSGKLVALVHPFYLRLDKAYYQELRTNIEATTHLNIWEKLKLPRWQAEPRLLLITSKYFLMGEVVGACQRLNIPHQLLTISDEEVGQVEFVEQLLQAVLQFRPDCVLTLNHLGVDREGVLVDLLSRMNLPLASWFVDNPQLILHQYSNLISPWTVIFTWDTDNLPILKAQGYPHTHYMPLGTDTQRFQPLSSRPLKALDSSFPCQVSFVGNSMVYKVGQRLRVGNFSRQLLLHYRQLAADFGSSPEHSIRDFILTQAEPIKTAYAKLPSDTDRLAFETMLTWESTRQYRALCVSQLLGFNPVIVGDSGWRINLKHTKQPWQLHSEVSYYDDLPRVYPFSTLNFNCTSKQMKGAVNQRIFDAPAAGAFVLTDWRAQMENLFEPTEIAYYHEPEEIPELVDFYLRNPLVRQKIVQAGRKRVLAQHTWGHRVQAILQKMREIYA